MDQKQHSTPGGAPRRPALPGGGDIGAFDRDRLVYELRTHQIELEMQNEELRRTEGRLREASKRYADLYDFAPVGYFTLTPRGVIRDVNLKGSMYLGVDRLHLIGTLFNDHVFHEDLSLYTDHLEDVVGEDAGLTCIVRLSSRHGQGSHVMIRSVPWRDGANDRISIRSVVTDISDQKRVEAELRLQKERAEQANVVKSQFLANMSHEIRTPLGVILGYTDILRYGAPKREEVCPMLEKIASNGQHLLALIDDILDLSKVEANELRVERLPLSLRHEIEAVVESFGTKARDKGLTLSVDWRDAPTTFASDPTRFRQIVLNIVGNAVKFSSRGSVTIVVGRVLGRPELVQIDVMDTGPGIAEKDRDLLFRPFTQADATTSRKFGGTGLGLCLARRLARALGGDVELVSSELDRGSTFRIMVDSGADLVGPMVPAEMAETEPETAELPSIVGVRVLLVEDTADNRYLYRRILESAGAIVETADNGIDAVGRAVAGMPDVVLMDLQLPKLDGFGATERLRDQGFERPILAVTAHALAEEKERTRQSGFDDHLTKPLKASELVRNVAKWARPLN